MPEIHPWIMSMVQVTIVVMGACALVLQAMRFLLAAILGVSDE